MSDKKQVKEEVKEVTEVKKEVISKDCPINCIARKKKDNANVSVKNIQVISHKKKERNARSQLRHPDLELFLLTF